MRYWDTSAIVLLLIHEKSSGSARKLLKSHGQITIWWATSVECYSAICRIERQTKMSNDEFLRVTNRLSDLSSIWHEVQPTVGIRESALRLLRVHTLRAADALQLAAALSACGQRPESCEFVTTDAKLIAAANREGFKTVSF